MFSVTELRCEYKINPIGLDVARPRLSWQLQPDDPARRGLRQTAYRLTVARGLPDLLAEQGLLWDSGRVPSDQSVHVEYGGPALGSSERVFWRVRVWDEAEAEAVSAPAYWETGLLRREDWIAVPIGALLAGGPRTPVPVPFLRKAFHLERKPAWARLYSTAFGIYEAYLNGERVGTDYLTPGWTDYRQRLQYQVYDVTDLLDAGSNCIGAILGDGWYCGHIEWSGRQHYGDRPRLLAQLMLGFEDGSTATIATDGTWRTAYGPILQADLLMGEHYDARREYPGWNKANFDDSRWLPAETFDLPPVALVGMPGPTVRVTETLTPVADPTEIKQWPLSRWIFDFGQNMSGVVRLKIRGKRGLTITLRHAEVLDADGKLYTANLRTAQQMDHYTLKGGDEDADEEIYTPRFTVHGFRYVELSGYPDTPSRDMLTALVMHSELEQTGTFTCSEPLLNQLQHNIWWGQRGNFVDIPTDCPQRDERLGWTGDAQVFIRTAAFNANVAPFFTKWLRDLNDAQSAEGQYPSVAPNREATGADGGPAWADAGIICPGAIYGAYGDRRALAEHYDKMARFMAYLERTSPGYIRCDPALGGWGGYGDWLSINASTPPDLIGTAFFAHDAALMAGYAALLDKAEDAARWRALRAQIEAAYQARFLTEDGDVHGSTQTAYVLTLHFGLAPEALRPRLVERLIADIRARNMHLSTGFVGTPYLLHVLSDHGCLDVAYALLMQKTWPSWLYPVLNGATTIWERWDGWTADKGFQDAGMNSFNHYAYGAVGDWLYRVVAGIESDGGYAQFRLRPRLGGELTSARAAYRSLHGEIISAWQIEGDQFRWEITVPPNTTAEAYLPGVPLETDGLPVIQAAEAGGGNATRLQVLPGRYTLVSRLEG